MMPLTDGLNTIRGRLIAGFGVLVLLLVFAGVVAKGSMNSLSWAIAEQLSGVQSESRLSGALTTSIAKTLTTGNRYLDTRDSATEASFHANGWVSHSLQRRLNELPN